jgi:hypothetical protein
MSLRLVGAGLPRTGTHSLMLALEQLLGGRCCHMSAIPGHPFNLGPGWHLALAGGRPDWSEVLAGYVAAVDWPASMFWRELAETWPDAPVLLSVRDSARTWYESVAATILPYARLPRAPDWKDGRDLLDLFERFAGKRWDDPATLMAAYERHNAEVRRAVPRERLVEWRGEDRWAPICRALGVAVPATQFPWVNKRSEWH